jgi:isopenicillin N synthase-like dioxygenase
MAVCVVCLQLVLVLIATQDLWSHAAGQQGIVAEAHTDRGLLTVVWESAPGLEVSSPRVYIQVSLISATAS